CFSRAYYDYYGGGDMMNTDGQWHESLLALSTQLSEVNTKLEIMELTALVSELTRKVDTLSAQAFHCPFLRCQLCGGSYPREGCPYNLQPAYHDYSWCNNRGPSLNFHNEPMFTSEFHHQPPIQEEKPSLEEVLEHYTRRMDAYPPKQEEKPSLENMMMQQMQRMDAFLQE
ncbi:hypothetical protein TorRG33x02_312300, partial [Trema orientale]